LAIKKQEYFIRLNSVGGHDHQYDQNWRGSKEWKSRSWSHQHV